MKQHGDLAQRPWDGRTFSMHPGTEAESSRQIDERYLVEQAQALVRINSVNPAFSGGATDEREVAACVEGELRALGMHTSRYEPEAGRVSVVGRLKGSGGGKSLMLYAHYDTVATDAMAGDPLSGEVRNGRIYGRGAFDMKGALAACMTAAKAVAESGGGRRGDLLIAAVADEEVASIGMQDVLRHVRPDAAIVTEATDLQLCLAHKGFSWIEVETEGRAAHGSRFDEGIDANMRMGRVLGGLDRLEQALRASPPHPLLGPPSLHAAVLRGGSGTSTYAAQCRLEIERRMLPGETEAGVVAQVQAIADRLAKEDPTFRASVRAFLTRHSFETTMDAPIARATMAAASAVLGKPPNVIGVGYWMDTALLGAAGVDTVCIGPSGAGAHGGEEWVDIGSLARLSEILFLVAREQCE